MSLPSHDERGEAGIFELVLAGLVLVGLFMLLNATGVIPG